MVAPSSLAARLRSCSALARSESSCVFWLSSTFERSVLNSSSTLLRISSNVGVAAGLIASNWKTAMPCDAEATSGGDFSVSVNTIHKLLGRPEAGQHILATEEVGRDHRQIVRRCCCVQALRASLFQQIFCFFLSDLLRLLPLQDRLNFAFHFIQ